MKPLLEINSVSNQIGFNPNLSGSKKWRGSDFCRGQTRLEFQS